MLNTLKITVNVLLYLRCTASPISDIFRHSTDKKEKEKDKEEKTDASSPAKEPAGVAAAGAPTGVDTPASPSPAPVAETAKSTPLRSRLGLRFRRSKVRNWEHNLRKKMAYKGVNWCIEVG